jgi:hypothetical protein
LDYLEQLGVSRDRLRVVVNRYGRPKEVPAAKAEEALGCKIAHYVPDDPKTVNRANNNGVPAVLESPLWTGMTGWPWCASVGQPPGVPPWSQPGAGGASGRPS